jgi:hypothetical protein
VGAEEVAEMVMVVEQLGVQEVGEKEAEAPEGRPETEKDPTDWEVPEAKLKLTVELPDEPFCTPRLVQEVLYEKDGPQVEAVSCWVLE